MKRLIGLYPRAWRERYEREFGALLDELPATPALAVDIARGAFVAHFDELIDRPAGRGWRAWALTPKAHPVIRTLLALLVLCSTLISLFGGAQVVISPFSADLMTLHVFAVMPWLVAIAVGIVTLVAVFALPDPGHRVSRLIAVAGVVLAAAGICGGVSVLLIGQATGDYEWGIGNVYGVLVVQGALTALYFYGRGGADRGRATARETRVSSRPRDPGTPRPG